MSVLVKLFLITVVLALISTGGIYLNYGSDLFPHRTVEGRVVENATRMAAVEGSLQQKFAIKLSPYRADSKVEDVAAGPSGVVIECASTRCATATVGTCQRFRCRYEWRGFTEPSVISCKHEKEVSCASFGGGR